MRSDGAHVVWITLLAIALLISILVARTISQRADREKAERIRAWSEANRKDAELLELRGQHAKVVSAKDSEYANLAAHMGAPLKDHCREEDTISMALLCYR